MLRFMLIPFFMLALEAGMGYWFGFDIALASVIALTIFVIASLTDLLDGMLARKLNLITDFGALMDPLADKVLVMAAMVYLVRLGALPAFVAITILAREFIISGIRMLALNKGVVISAGLMGKLKTVTQMLMIIILMLGLIFDQHLLNIIGWVLIWAALTLTILSLVEYITKNLSIWK